MDAARANSWTVLIYTSASHDLETAVTQSLEEITQQGTPQDVRVVAQMGAQGSVQRYQLHQVARPEPLEAGRTADMTDPAELQRFLRWGMEKYPSEHYAVVLGGHGAGFAGAVTDSQRRKMISLPDLEKSLGQLPNRPDLVIFNTCLMAQAEVASQLQGVSDNLVASQSKLLGLGLPLADWMQQLPGQPSGSAAAQKLVESARGLEARAPAVSSIDLRGWPQLQNSLDKLAGAILENPQCSQQLRHHILQQPELWPQARDRPLVDQIDVAALCRDWRADEKLPESLRRQAGEVVSTIARLCHSSRAMGGLSAYLPDQSNGPLVEQIYARLRFARETRWDEALQNLSNPI